MDNKQKWAINKLHKVSKHDATPIIYFHFAEISKSEPVNVDLGTLPYIADYDSDRPDKKKAEKRRLLKGLKELVELELLKKLHSHNWRMHTVMFTPLDNLTAKLKGK